MSDPMFISSMVCMAVGVWLALTGGHGRCHDCGEQIRERDEPIRLADGWWFPKAKGPPPPAPPAPPARPQLTNVRVR